MFGFESVEIRYNFKVATIRKGDGDLEYVATSMTQVDGLGLPVILAEGNDKDQVISQAEGLTQDEIQLDRSSQEAVR